MVPKPIITGAFQVLKGGAAEAREEFLPYGRHSISEDDIEAVVEALQSSHLTQGPLVERFESALASHLHAPFVSVVSNGTAALQLAYSILGLEPGDELITSPITFVATANAARALGAEVRFADVEPDTGNLDVTSVEALITPRTRGITAVHFGGLPVDLAPLRALANRHDLWLVEDAAHALGAVYRGSSIGSCALSDATTFSFHPVKHLTTAEGGAIAVRSEAAKRWLDRLRQHGVERDSNRFVSAAPGPWYYEAQVLGYNFRLSDLQCALGLSQLQKQRAWLWQRRALAACYREQIKQHLGGLAEVQAERDDRESAYHLLPVLIDFEAAKKSRARVMEALKLQNIGTQVHYIPVNWQPYYVDRYGTPNEQPGVSSFYHKELSLPLYPALREADVARVVQALTQSLLG